MENLYGHAPSHETEPQYYEFFDDPNERSEVFRYSQKIAEYLRSEGVPNLVIVDRSSRPLYVGVREYLRSKYPDEKMPNIYFMNPKGFKAREDLTPEEIEDIVEDCEWKDDIGESPNRIRSKKDVMEEFEKTYKQLMRDKNLPVLVFDTCLHTGNSLAPIKKVLQAKNFSDIRIGSVNPSDPESKVRTDFYITLQRPEKGCYPFDRDKMIEKTFDHVYSMRTPVPRKRERSIRLRKEIKSIIQDYLQNEIVDREAIEEDTEKE